MYNVFFSCQWSVTAAISKTKKGLHRDPFYSRTENIKKNIVTQTIIDIILPKNAKFVKLLILEKL